MKYVLGTLLVLLILTGCIGAGTYVWLAPEEQPQPEASELTLRKVDGGEVIGYENASGALVWQGIPYAAPPLGELRWKAPRPPIPWEGRMQALAVGNECASQNRATTLEDNVVEGNEDCLYLNIFSPATADSALPVMFWIHGGANTIGSGGGVLYDGSALATRHDVVVVTINYRLGPFGWFTHPALRSVETSAEDNSGNYGTLDQIYALKWVQNNIAAFGGDPGKVTIFGESAGGWNVLAMLASPLTIGQFHGAISQSGRLDIDPVSVGENYIDDEEPGNRLSSREIINQLLILDESAIDEGEARAIQEGMTKTELGNWLRNKTTAEIFAAYRTEEGRKVSILPDLFGDGHVLPAGLRSRDLFSNTATYNAVPVILGTNLDEMKLFLALNPELVDTLLGIPVGIKDRDRYAKANRYATDVWKVHGVDSLVTVMRDAGVDNVFAYRFDADDLRDFGLVDLQELFGAAHAFEIPYVFGNFPNPTNLLFKGDSILERDALSSAMMSYWAEFAYTGNPGRGRNGKQVEWSAWQNGSDETARLMILDSTLGDGIRMSPIRISIADIKQRFFADTSFTDQQEYCQGYKTLFRYADFVQAEYDNLGETGCE
jgi:para-nitrobenzyl esterase